MVHKRGIALSEAERQALIEYRDHDRRAQVRERCAAILKIAAGQSAHAVAQNGLLKRREPDTVYGWLNEYERAGLVGLLSGLQGGNHRSFRHSKG